jgi:hypothetical protein
MNQGESNVKRSKKSGLANTRAWVLGLTLLVGAMSTHSQTFDLLAAKPADKVAESLFFTIDSNKVLNAYKMFAFASPVMETGDSIFVVGGFHSPISSAKNIAENPVRDFSLGQNFPNPFNPTTTIRFNIRKRAKVSLVLYDVTGKEVSTLVNEDREPGNYDAHWSGTSNHGTSVASGTYFYRLLAIADDGVKTVETKRMTLIR